MRLRCLSVELNIRFSQNFKGTNKKCNKKKDFEWRSDKEMKKVYKSKNKLRETHSNMNIN